MPVTLTLRCDGCHASGSIEGTSVFGEAEAFARAFTCNHANCPVSPPPNTADRTSPSAQAITAAVAAVYGLTVQAVRGTSRTMQIASARALAMYLCRRLRADSFPEIGRYFGRDHTTVIEACKKVEKLLGGHGSWEKTSDRHAQVLEALGL